MHILMAMVSETTLFCADGRAAVGMVKEINLTELLLSLRLQEIFIAYCIAVDE